MSGDRLRLYRYVGPSDIRARVATQSAGAVIAAAPDLLAWLDGSKQCPGPDGLIAVTFVTDTAGRLLISDRRSEHVACAGGGMVLAAGELFFHVEREQVTAVEVSNQSTGYCPEPESWPAIAAALDRAGISHPGRFTREIVFRRCPACSERNVVKDGWFVCALCGADLPERWNF
jgi:hypothetical protein